MPLSHQRVRTALFLALTALLTAAVGLHQHDAAASVEKATVVKQQPENLTPKHSFSGKPPKGTWSVAAIPELGQATDTTTPVVVSGLSSLFGKKEWGGFLTVIAMKSSVGALLFRARVRRPTQKLNFYQAPSCARAAWCPTMPSVPRSPQLHCLSHAQKFFYDFRHRPVRSQNRRAYKV